MFFFLVFIRVNRGIPRVHLETKLSPRHDSERKVNEGETNNKALFLLEVKETKARMVNL